MRHKLFFLTAVLGLLGALAVIPAFGQEDQMVVNVPFQFVVRDQVMPSGRYLIQPLDEVSPDLMLIRNMRTGQEAVFLTESVKRMPYEQRSDLVFRQVRGQDVLSRVWLADNSYDSRLIHANK